MNYMKFSIYIINSNQFWYIHKHLGAQIVFFLAPQQRIDQYYTHIDILQQRT